MGKRRACPECNSHKIFVGGMNQLKCKECGAVFPRSLAVYIDYVPTNPRAKSTRRQADKQEKRQAKKLAARQTIASGQTPIDKADIKSDLLRVECKYTDKKSYSLKYEDLRKVANASTGDQMPLFQIDFRDRGSYYIVPEGWFLQLLESYRRDNQIN